MVAPSERMNASPMLSSTSAPRALRPPRRPNSWPASMHTPVVIAADDTGVIEVDQVLLRQRR